MYYRDEAARQTKANVYQAQASEKELIRVKGAIVNMRSDIYHVRYISVITQIMLHRTAPGIKRM